MYTDGQYCLMYIENKLINYKNWLLMKTAYYKDVVVFYKLFPFIVYVCCENLLQFLFSPMTYTYTITFMYS